jgi:hypothetical protein
MRGAPWFRVDTRHRGCEVRSRPDDDGTTGLVPQPRPRAGSRLPPSAGSDGPDRLHGGQLHADGCVGPFDLELQLSVGCG